MSLEQTIIVDENDCIIGGKQRKKITTNDIYRVSACWIVDKKWDILLAQRSFTKKHNPGKRWPAVAWTNEVWETYLDNIIKEIKEETNIIVQEKQLIVWPKVFYKDSRTYFWQWFILIYTWDKEIIKPELWAIEQLKRHKTIELKKLLHNKPDIFLQSMQNIFDTLSTYC